MPSRFAQMLPYMPSAPPRPPPALESSVLSWLTMPVLDPVEQRHAGRGICIQLLLGGDDLDLVGVDVESQFRSRNLLAGIMDTLQLRKVPVCSFKQVSGCRGHGAAFSCLRRR